MCSCTSPLVSEDVQTSFNQLKSSIQHNINLIGGPSLVTSRTGLLLYVEIMAWNDNLIIVQSKAKLKNVWFRKPDRP